MHEHNSQFRYLKKDNLVHFCSWFRPRCQCGDPRSRFPVGSSIFFYPHCSIAWRSFILTFSKGYNPSAIRNVPLLGLTMLFHGLVSSENAISSHFVPWSFNQNNTKSFSCRKATKIKHESKSRDRYLRNVMSYHLTSSKALILRHQWTIYLIYSSSNIVQSLACLGVYILTSEL